MASYPPFPPPPGGPYGYDPKIAARAFRAQERSRKQAFRIQRDLARQQARAMRRTSVVGPLIIVAIGVTLLLVRNGNVHLSSFLLWYGRWWPALLVGAGLVMVLEWAIDQRRSNTATPPVHRGIGAAVVFLLILIGITGAGVSQIHNVNDLPLQGIKINGNNLEEFFGEKHELSEDVDHDFPAGTVLSVDNPRGDVTITGRSLDNRIHIASNKQVFSRSDSDANSRAQELTPRFSMDGNTLRVTIQQVDGASSDLAITVPESAQTTINANKGDVRVSAMRAPLNITSNHGDVEVTASAGPVIVYMNHTGNSLAAHQLTGDLTLKGRAEDLNISDISGRVSLEGEFYGDTHLEHVAGPLKFDTSRTHFSLVRLDGAVDLSPNSELTGDQILGPVELRTRSRNITLGRISGGVDIRNSNGTVDLTNTIPLGDVQVENTNGAVNVTVPNDAAFSVEAETSGGSIENDFGLPVTTERDRTRTQGVIKSGKAHVTLHTTHADVGIHHGEVPSLLPPPPPTPPTPPTAPTPPLTSLPINQVKSKT